jgi:hypothetical protein
MDTDRPSKTCRYCLEPIHAEARRCPHCRSWQSRWAALLHPASYFVYVAATLAFFAVLLVFAAQMTSEGEDFADWREKARVVESQMTFEAVEDGQPRIVVVAVLENESPVPWGRLSLEARFYDTGGQLIDVDNEWDVGVALPAHGSHACRLVLVPYLSVDRYASHEVFVRAAKDERKPW